MGSFRENLEGKNFGGKFGGGIPKENLVKFGSFRKSLEGKFGGKFGGNILEGNVHSTSYKNVIGRVGICTILCL
jgi:hypothetical protein